MKTLAEVFAGDAPKITPGLGDCMDRNLIPRPRRVAAPKPRLSSEEERVERDLEDKAMIRRWRGSVTQLNGLTSYQAAWLDLAHTAQQMCLEGQDRKTRHLGHTLLVQMSGAKANVEAAAKAGGFVPL